MDAKREGRQLRGRRGAERIQEVMPSTADADGRVRKPGRSAHFNVARKVDRRSGVACGVGDGVATRAGATSKHAPLVHHPSVRLVPQTSLLAEPTVATLQGLVGLMLLDALHPWHERQDHSTLLLAKADHLSPPICSSSDAIVAMRTAWHTLVHDPAWLHANVACPKCYMPAAQHSVRWSHINRYVAGEGTFPHQDTEPNPDRATVMVILLPQSAYEGGGKLRVGSEVDGSVRLRKARKEGGGNADGKEPTDWMDDSRDAGMEAAWDAVWLDGISMWHGVTKVREGVRYSLCLCVVCGSCM
jgi:hypothetical protein